MRGRSAICTQLSKICAFPNGIEFRLYESWIKLTVFWPFSDGPPLRFNARVKGELTKNRLTIRVSHSVYTWQPRFRNQLWENDTVYIRIRPVDYYLCLFASNCYIKAEVVFVHGHFECLQHRRRRRWFFVRKKKKNFEIINFQIDRDTNLIRESFKNFVRV